MRLTLSLCCRVSCIKSALNLREPNLKQYTGIKFSSSGFDIRKKAASVKCRLQDPNQQTGRPLLSENFSRSNTCSHSIGQSIDTNQSPNQMSPCQIITTIIIVIITIISIIITSY